MTSSAPAELITLTPAQRNPALVYLASLDSMHSRRTMRGALRRTLRVLKVDADEVQFPWARLRYAEVVAARAALAQAYPNGSAAVNGSVSALRGVMREAFRLGQLTGEEWARIKDVRGVTSTRLPAGRDVPEGELVKLFAACDRSSVVGIRDAALLALLRVTGMRRAEVCSIAVADIDLGNGRLRVIGKRRKQRVCHLGDAQVDLEAWLDVRGPEDGPLFLSWSARAQEFRLRGLTESGVYNILRRLAVTAGIPMASPHDYRRSFIGDLLDQGVDLATVQKLAGHEDPKTTARYDRRGDETRKAAVSKLKIPR